VALAKELPAKPTVTLKLPLLHGSPKSDFKYTLNMENDSGREHRRRGAIEFRNLVHRSLW
jgi:hypothetical protein